MTEMKNDGPEHDSRAHVEMKWTGGQSVRRVAMLWIAVMVWGASLAVPDIAQAQSALQEVTWGHRTPNTVARFVVFVSSTEGDQAGAQQINVGKPANPTLQGGLYVYSATISVDLTQYVAIAAVSLDGSLSELSAWASVPPSNPGQPFYIP